VSRTEADFGLRSRLVLIDTADDGLDRVQASAGLRGGLVSLLGAVAGIDGMLVSLRRLRIGLPNTFLGARIDVLDLASVLGAQVVKLVDAITNRAQLTLYILLARHRIDLSPEALARLRLQWLTGRKILVGSCVLRGRGGLRTAGRGRLRSALAWVLLGIRSGLLRYRRYHQSRGQRQRK